MTFADLSGLPSVSFAPQSAGETETAIITAYEAIAKATLQPAIPCACFWNRWLTSFRSRTA